MSAVCVCVWDRYLCVSLCVCVYICMYIYLGGGVLRSGYMSTLPSTGIPYLPTYPSPPPLPFQPFSLSLPLIFVVDNGWIRRDRCVLVNKSTIRHHAINYDTTHSGYTGTLHLQCNTMQCTIIPVQYITKQNSTMP